MSNSTVQPTVASGAAVVLASARQAGVEVCFANPGTTEMPFVTALDEVPGVRAVLGLFEGVCTGAADGYGRMAGKPAMTLLHLGPGFANGIANLHNARRARTPIVNVIGDHATWHLKYDAPLTSDIASLARPVSVWYHSTARADALAQDTAEACAAAMGPQRGSATLVVPVDLQQATLPLPAAVAAPQAVRPAVAAARIDAVADALRSGGAVVFLLGDDALSARGQRASARLAAATGAKVYAETFPARIERGGGLPDTDRLPYFPEPAIAALKDARVVLAGALPPIAYFGYEGLPSELAPAEALLTLAAPGEAAEEALVQLADRLADRLAGAEEAGGVPPARHEVPAGALTPRSIGQLLSNALPDDAIVSVEGGTCGYPFVTASAGARRHTILTNTGGAIGQGLPVALGAAIACPDRRVFALQSDGSAQYTIQTLWTLARERLPVVLLIASNRRYGILQTELQRSNSPLDRPNARALTLLDDPPFDWAGLAGGYGVPCRSVDTNEALEAALAEALAHTGGPLLIEMRLP